MTPIKSCIPPFRRFLLFASAFITLASCNQKVQFSRTADDMRLKPNSLAQTPRSPVEKNVLQIYRPALAVRATGCVTCHAQFKGNVVTDFGFGSPSYLGQNHYQSFLEKNFFGFDPLDSGVHFLHGTAYGDHWGSWSTSQFSKQSVIVPKAAMIPAKIRGLHNPNELSLADYLRQRLKRGSPEARVETRQSIFIGAPNSAQLRESFAFKKGQSLFVYRPNHEDSFVDNINVAFDFNDDEKTAVQTEAAILKCNGDLFIDGAVKLVNLRLETQSGCRLYATGSVFIQGPIRFVGAYPNRNLQISSARAIVLGLGENTCGAKTQSLEYWSRESTLDNRLSIWTNATHVTRGTRGAAEDKAKILDDYYRVGKIREALCEPNGAKIGFERVLLNAPQIHSRYSGNFNGVIIAEVAVLCTEPMTFAFDPVFLRVPVLPYLPGSTYLAISNK